MRDPHFQQLSNEIEQAQRRWLLVAYIFHKIVDIAYDDRVATWGAAGVSKTIELCENERVMPGNSQLRAAWSAFRDVAHLIAAGAYLAREGMVNTVGREASVLQAVWLAPDAVIAIAGGFQTFWLQQEPLSKKDCPSSDDLRRFERFRNGGSGSSGLEFMRLSVDAASVGLRWLLA